MLADRQRAGWLLPIVTAEPRARAARVLSRFIEQRQLRATLVCVTGGIVDAQSAGIDWLAIADRADSDLPCPPLQEVALRDLLRSTALISVQARLLRSYGRLSARSASSASEGWLALTLDWLRSQLPDDDGGSTLEAIPHRAELLSATWEFRRRAAPALFLKWRHDGSFAEAALTETLRAFDRSCAPRTVAVDRANGRWLTEAVPGSPLAQQLSTTTVARVAAAVARLQMAFASGGAPHAASLPTVAGSLADLPLEGDRILQCLPGWPDAPEIRDARREIRGAAAALRDLRLPDTWIHTDLVPENVFVDGERVSFIDFDDFWIGPAPVAMEFLFAGLRRLAATADERAALQSAALQAFIEAWRESVAPPVLRAAYRWTRLIAEVSRVSTRLRKLRRMEENGELCGLVDAAHRQSAERLTMLTSPAAQ